MASPVAYSGGAAAPPVLRSRRHLLRTVAATALVGLACPLLAQTRPAPSTIITTTIGEFEALMAKSYRLAATRHGLTVPQAKANAYNIATQLATKAPRGGPWVKALAAASPVGRVISMIGGVYMAYDALKDLFTVSPGDTVARDTWDGNNPRCSVNQACTFRDPATGVQFGVITTYETSPSSSNWTYSGQYPILKQTSLGSTRAPYVYQVWWKLTVDQLSKTRDPRPQTPTDKKPEVRPAALTEYLADKKDDKVVEEGVKNLMNDVIEQAEKEGKLPANSPRIQRADVAKAMSEVVVKVADVLKDTPIDRPPVLTIPEVGANPDPDEEPEPTPGTGTNPGTGGGGGGGTPPVTGDGQLDLGQAPDPGDPAVPDLPDLVVPTVPTAGLPPGQCPNPSGTWKGHTIDVSEFCDFAEQNRTRMGGLFRTVYMGMAAAILWRV